MTGCAGVSSSRDPKREVRKTGKFQSWHCFDFYILNDSLKYLPKYNAVIFILLEEFLLELKAVLQYNQEPVRLVFK